MAEPIRVSPGWTATEAGYWISDDEAREILSALRTYRYELTHWRNAYNERHVDALQQAKDFTQKLNDLEAALNDERTKTDAAIKAANRRIGFGLFAGAGYAGSGGFDGVIGAGVLLPVF